MTTVALQDVTKIFPDGTRAVDRVNLDVADGEFLVLLGPSGCGKSTVLRMVAGLEEPTTGAVVLDGDVVNHLPPGQRRIAMVFQDFALYPHLSVGDNIAFPLLLSGVEPVERRERVTDVACGLSIGDVLARKPRQLSGGQRQRVAIGRAIVRRPGVFLMDEPLSNLDSGLRAELRAEISSLVRDLGVTTIYVTHDQTEALTMADRVAIMRDGVLQDVGTPNEVYRRPGTLFVGSFLGTPRMSLLRASVHVYLDRHVTLRLGDQALYLPWDDLRTGVVAKYHAERIVIGVRAEALSPVSPDAAGHVLRGRIRHLEHHGHESVAYLDIGASAAVTESSERPVTLPSGTVTVPARIGHAVQRLARRGIDRATDRSDSTSTAIAASSVGTGPGQASRHQERPAELAIRLGPYPAVAADQQLTVSVRLDALHFFDARGRRIDVGWRK